MTSSLLASPEPDSESSKQIPISSNVASLPTEQDGIEKLEKIHSKLSLVHGSFSEEYPEQLMAAMFINENAKVLELGGNVGRNSCVISAILNDSKNLVVLESDPNAIPALTANRNHNNQSFHIENSALSKVPLVQSGWTTVPSEIIPPGYIRINTLSYDQIKEKYNTTFDVLVADCEGALYYILRDDDSMLKDLNMIVVENDYTHRPYYEDTRDKFTAHGFQLVYNKEGGWGCCYNEFYQVWKKP